MMNPIQYSQTEIIEQINEILAGHLTPKAKGKLQRKLAVLKLLKNGIPYMKPNSNRWRKDLEEKIPKKTKEPRCPEPLY